MSQLILYSKPGCHLCEGLQEKLEQVQLPFELEIRDITTRPEWFQTYEYDIPVLLLIRTGSDAIAHSHRGNDWESPHPQSAIRLPRLSPRATVQQVEQMLQKYLTA
jgi:hypothetical protein